jgi:hypothetical protein
MPEAPPVAALAHVIQLAVAPVFLVTGLAGMLAVLTNRLARVVDRARGLEGRLPAAAPHDATMLHRELATLARRASLINWAITLCTTAALLVSAVIALLFLGAFLAIGTAAAVAWLFIGAMVAFFSGLVCFLREIFVATAALRIGPH